MLTRPGHVHYPSSDGLPMTDKDLNRLLMEYVENAIAFHFRDDPMVYVSANLFLFYEKDNPDRRIAPDVFVVKGVPRRPRETYLLWEEGKAPDVVFEFASRSSWRRDAGSKLEDYALVGVPECYLFDPTGELLDPPFQAHRIEDGAYRRLPATDRVVSPALGLEIRVAGELLEIVNPGSGKAYPLPQDAYRAADRAEREAERARRLEAELERLRRRLDEE